jgi:hypothetical protein
VTSPNGFDADRTPTPTADWLDMEGSSWTLASRTAGRRKLSITKCQQTSAHARRGPGMRWRVRESPPSRQHDRDPWRPPRTTRSSASQLGAYRRPPLGQLRRQERLARSGGERHRRRHRPSLRHKQTRILQPIPAPGGGSQIGDHHMVIFIAGSMRGSTRSVPSGPPCQACSVRPTPVHSRPSTSVSKRVADSWITKPLFHKHDWAVALP